MLQMMASILFAAVQLLSCIGRSLAQVLSTAEQVIPQKQLALCIVLCDSTMAAIQKRLRCCVVCVLLCSMCHSECVVSCAMLEDAQYLDLEKGFVKQQHEVPDHTQHLARICCIVLFTKVLSHFLHLSIHLLLKLLWAGNPLTGLVLVSPAYQV